MDLVIIVVVERKTMALLLCVFSDIIVKSEMSATI